MNHKHASQNHAAGPDRLKVSQGDVLVCQCGDCNVELTVSTSCSATARGAECEIDVSCCGKPMKKKGR